MNRVALIAFGSALFATCPAQQATRDPFVGTWIGTRQKNDIKRVVITASKGGYECEIRAFATFEEIDWGKRPLHVYFADVASKIPVSAIGEWSADFGKVTVIFHRRGRELEIEDLTRFTDKSGRSDYDSIERLKRRLHAK
jgi:hypothetical protein